MLFELVLLEELFAIGAFNLVLWFHPQLLNITNILSYLHQDICIAYRDYTNTNYYFLFQS